MKTATVFAVFAALLIVPRHAGAQQLDLQIQDGVVTLNAQNVSVRQILAEWARIGGAKVVNGEKVAGGPVTLQLNGVPERQALDTVLRGVSGYMLAPRQVASNALSGFDRILILPTSSAPRAGGMPAATPFPMPPARPAQRVETDVVEDTDQDPADPAAMDPDGPEGGSEEEVVAQPPPGMNPQFQRRPAFPNPMGVQAQPYPGTIPTSTPESEDDAPQPVNTPLNVPPGASATPGVIAPVPQTQDPQQVPRPVRTTRPPL